MAVDITPMKRQYNEIKQQYSDCLLFFRLGDFYEMFDEDARKASRELDLALTTRDRGKPEDERTPMCGVPYHSAEAYIARLIQKGYKVAICEQTEDPALAKGLVRRDVIRVITPGTVLDASMLEEGRSNYICALTLSGGRGAAAFCDISTGELCAARYETDAAAHIQNELARFSPREVVADPGALADTELTRFMSGRLGCLVENGEGRFGLEEGESAVTARFDAELAELGLSDAPEAVMALGALLSYLADTQKCDLANLRRPDMFEGGRYMELDYSARRSLELTENLRTGEKRGSLLWVLDRTKTPMGGRLLRSWLERPLLSPVAIDRRLSAVQELFDDNVARAEIIRVLGGVCDMQRLVGRAVYATANGRDLASLAACCAALPELTALLSGSRSALLREAAGMDTLADVRNDIARAVCDEPRQP